MAITLNGTSGITTADVTTDTLTSNGIDDNATSTAITIDASNNVSIGTATVGVNGLSLSKDINLGWEQSSGESLANMFRQQTSGALVLAQGYQRSATSNGFASSFSSSAGRTAIWLADTIRFYTDPASTVSAGTDITPTERVRIDNSGYVMVNTTTSEAVFNVYNTGSWIYSSKTNSTGTVGHFRFDNGNGFVGSITTSGSSTAFNTTSDYRLKENLVSLDNAADRLKQIPVHRFNFIADPDTTVDGFLAHEVADVVPEAISGAKDEVDDEGNPVYQGIDQSKLVPLLTAALQEALTKIESLETRLSALEAS